MIKDATPLNAISQRILDNLNSAVLLFDNDFRLQYMNPAAEMLFAVSNRHMVGLDAGQLLHCPGDLVESNLNRAVELGRPFTERELSIPLSDRRSATVDCTVIPLYEREGKGGVLVELQQIDRQLRISREEHLLSQHQAARDLIRGLAHEIKNPLGGLRGAAQLLEGELEAPSLSEYTQVIIDEADRLQTLVDQMLGPNKLPRHAEVNIHTVLERVRSLVIAEFGDQILVERDYDPSIPDLYLDNDRIIQALLNIVRNAARAVGEQGDGNITLRTRILRQFTIGNIRHRLVAEISVEDNGPGIPGKIREKLFYPMVTASEGGMGLGLSIAQSLINQHGGLIECRSEPGCTVFNVLLPVENPNAKK
ncbi:nitrogen regulation protein NR(II) [Solemya velesiana gill symbiont]|uniref:Sensory histidine kinase/phosphatase NtrB n=1 Tax=Solemya velesiana gill symbiont TaxID=1918948 RepID=A0A1T2KRX6_9GAMM|nr:nitrogen regulation protein NR(II) [Solemya velesiana gill symbiont]OOZ35607.1 PAS domain-containing sensor histidine kinase [Solemya velesiana gill symbiont]